MCDKTYTPDLALEEDFPVKFRRWKEERELIQNVWPDAKPIQREQLQSGICSDKCWDQLFPKETPEELRDEA